MSGLINKAKEAAKDVLHGDKGEDPRSDNSGPHKSSMMNKLDPRVDSDRDNRDDPNSRVGGYGDDRTFSENTGGTGSTMGGGNQYNNPRSDNAGPHSSNLMNRADPRVDSDRDGRNDPTSHTGGYGQTQDNFGTAGGAGYGSGPTHHGTTTTSTTHHGTTTGTVGGAGYGTGTTTGAMGGSQYDDPRSTNAGPHSSNLMNRADPRVDSDRDGRNDPTSRVGGYGNTQDTYGAGNVGGQHAGYGGAAGNTYGGNTTGGMGGSQFDDPRSTNTGPHSSNLLNKADPRVDSDRDNRNDQTSRVGGYGDTQQGYGAGGGFSDTTAPGGHHGHHGHHATPGSGDANRTAGPHDSNILNKVDPRVDSDMDGSRTYGGDRTNY